MPMTATPSTLGEAFEQSYRRFAERPLLSWRGTTVTYGNVDLAARRLAAAYRRMGVVHGDRILCQLPNRAEILVSAAAAWKLGAIHVGADKDLTAVEVRSLLRWLRPTVAVVSGRMAGELSPPDTADPDRAGPMVVVCEGGTALGRARPWSELLEGTEELEAPSPLSPDDPAVILLTSGTTGRPKGVIRRQGQLLSHWTTTATFLEASPADRHLAQLPLSHGFGFGLAVAAVLTGGHLYLVDRFVAEEIFELVTAERITILNGTATHFDRLLKGFDPSLHDVSSLRAGAGSATRFPVTVLSGIFNQLGMRFVHTYGCSEGLGWKTVDREEILRGSAGSPPADHIRIVGPDGQPLPPGQVGEILVRKTHPVDYWGQPEATGGGDADWHSMGDLGLIGEDGLLFISGRVGHQVNRGGIRIDPGEVENGLAAHPDLLDVAVVGVPDASLGEVVCVCIVPRSAGGPGLEDLRSYLAPFLARHKLPERLRVVERIPRTRLSKVDRGALRSVAVDGPGDNG